MGFLDKQRDSAAAKVADGAREAWDAGLRAFVFAPHTAWSSTPNSRALSAEVDAVMAIGWELHSTAMTFVDKTGANNVTMLFTFVRPR